MAPVAAPLFSSRGTSAAIEQETVRAVVEAYAQDRISLPKPNGKTSKNRIRYAPSFMIDGEEDGPGAGPDHPYTARIVADYLGWDERKVGYTLGALEPIAPTRGSGRVPICVPGPRQTPAAGPFVRLRGAQRALVLRWRRPGSEPAGTTRAVDPRNG